jgi:hypothetical protein
VATVHDDVSSLEEQLLRVLYEGSASARECAAQLAPYARLSVDRIREIEHLLREFARHRYLGVETDSAETRYSLTLAGSERLAELVE